MNLIVEVADVFRTTSNEAGSVHLVKRTVDFKYKACVIIDNQLFLEFSIFDVVLVSVHN